MKKRTLLIWLAVMALFVAFSPMAGRKVFAENKVVAAQIGTDVTLSVSTTANVKSWEWQYSDDQGVSWRASGLVPESGTGAGISTVVIAITEEHHERMVRCKITYYSGTSTNVMYSDSWTLRISPSWIQNPEAVVARVGEKARFTAEAIGTGVSYQWQYSSDGGATWKNSAAKGATTSTAEFTVKGSHDGYWYRCQGKDLYGQITYSGWAQILVQPEIIEHPESQSVKVGSMVTLSVKFAGANPRYQWQYSNDGGVTWKNSNATGSQTAVIKFKAQGSSNGRLYRCQIKEAHNLTLTSSSAWVRVVSELTTQPDNWTGEVGEKANFRVGATGAGLKFQWQYSHDGGKTWKNSNASGAKTAAITFTAKNSYDGALYRCVITDANGAVLISNPASLTIDK